MAKGNSAMECASGEHVVWGNPTDQSHYPASQDRTASTRSRATADPRHDLEAALEFAFLALRCRGAADQFFPACITSQYTVVDTGSPPDQETVSAIVSIVCDRASAYLGAVSSTARVSSVIFEIERELAHYSATASIAREQEEILLYFLKHGAQNRLLKALFRLSKRQIEEKRREHGLQNRNVGRPRQIPLDASLRLGDELRDIEKVETDSRRRILILHNRNSGYSLAEIECAIDLISHIRRWKRALVTRK